MAKIARRKWPNVFFLRCCLSVFAYTVRRLKYTNIHRKHTQSQKAKDIEWMKVVKDDVHLHMCADVFGKKCSLAQKRHSHNSGDPLGSHKNKDDHRKRRAEEKKTLHVYSNITPYQLDDGFYWEKPEDRNRIRDRPLVLTSMVMVEPNLMHIHVS